MSIDETTANRLDVLNPYHDAGLTDDLIPLHRYDAVDADGTVRGKTPLDAGWRRKEYQRWQIENHVRGGGNVGFRIPDGWIILDFDPRNAPGRDVLVEFEVTYGLNLADYPCVRTGSGGLHAYGRAPLGTRPSNGIADMPGVEFKALGRQVVVPGSIHPCGEYYEWMSGGPELKSTPAWPDALLAGIRKDRAVVAAGATVAPEPLDRIKAVVDQIPPTEGAGRHDYWIQVGMAIHQASGADPEALGVWQEWSARDSHYKHEANAVCEHRWGSFTLHPPGAGVDMGTLVKLAKDGGGVIPPPARASADEVFGVVEQPAEAEAPVVSRATPLDTAKGFLTVRRPHLHHHNGDWLDWDGAAYTDFEEGTIEQDLTRFLERAQERVKVEGDDGEDEWRRRAFKPTERDVSNVRKMLRHHVHVPRERFEPPCWIDDGQGPPPREIISCRNGLLHLPTGQLLSPTPKFLTRNALEFDHDPGASAPGWENFLKSVWPNDDGSALLLQEMFGYLLTPETKLQAMFFLIGPKRSGRGTIGRVLQELVGRRNTTWPSLRKMGGQFGLQALIAKQLALVGDLQLGPRADLDAIVEDLLKITGEDSVTVDRKHKEAWEGRLSVRFVVMSNKVPRLPNESGALAARLIPLKFTISHAGKEDRDLGDRLHAELPGILNWAIEGWRRLRERGRFVLPEASKEVLQEFADAASPPIAFAREKCLVDPGVRIEKAALYAAWCAWCRDQGRLPGTAAEFGRDLLAAMGEKVIESRPWIGGSRVYCYSGICLAEDDPLFK